MSIKQLRVGVIGADTQASWARDMRAGTFHTPGFAHALHNSRLVAAVEHAAQTGVRQRIPG